uniref:COBRA C-terminal domain-containing protein n=1 Tax=Solanum lycopersicum TaxID=4081 RepID=A0A3Q7FSQ9_SOLLC
MMGVQATDQGDCSKVRGIIPHSCEKKPSIVLICCLIPLKTNKLLTAARAVLWHLWERTLLLLTLHFRYDLLGIQTNTTVKLPKNFTLVAPGGGYTCGPAKIIRPTQFVTNDGRRVTQAMSKVLFSTQVWNYMESDSQFLAAPKPTCCVSPLVLCVLVAAATVATVSVKIGPSYNRAMHKMCPINVHWHVKSNYNKIDWSVKMTITNFNYTQWTLVVQHPNLNNMTQPCFMGESHIIHILMQAGPKGNRHSDLTLEKDGKTIALKNPQRAYFNGNLCVMPSPESYPFLPNSAGTI